jgi:hypothetical protein
VEEFEVMPMMTVSNVAAATAMATMTMAPGHHQNIWPFEAAPARWQE